MNETLKILEYNQILEKLKSYIISDTAKEKADNLDRIKDEEVCNGKIREAGEARQIAELIGMPPIGSADHMIEALEHARRGEMLTPDQLEGVLYFITSCKRMKDYLKRSEYLEYQLSFYGRGFYSCEELREEIERTIRGGEVDVYASKRLKDITGDLEKKKDQVKEKLDKLLKAKKNCFTDHFVVQRDNRYVLPVKKECKGQVKGSVIDMSSSGNTLFIEPDAAARFQGEIAILEIERDNEIRRILYELTDKVAKEESSLKINADMMAELDFIFAKGKLGIDMQAETIFVSEKQYTKLTGARHPLLDTEDCVPLDFEIGGETRGIVITGPNTGGKTVALKTVGLLTAMAQRGLMIPAEKGGVLSNSEILCDIGDGQNITESLSTFSSHIKNIIQILEKTKRNSLILLDELGSGTDPAEGMGIAVSILEALRQKECLFLATTHYPEVKEYARKAEGVVNARMAFDKESLKPLYQMVIGEAGESCALYIAQKLGFPEELLKIADSCAYSSYEPKEIKKRKNQEKRKKEEPKKEKEKTFYLGDSVMIPSSGEKGIICEEENEQGEIRVQIKGVKTWYRKKRVKLLVKAKEMYPEDYDFSIIFDTVENRKARHILGKRYDPNVKAEYERGET